MIKDTTTHTNLLSLIAAEMQHRSWRKSIFCGGRCQPLLARLNHHVRHGCRSIWLKWQVRRLVFRN